MPLVGAGSRASDRRQHLRKKTVRFWHGLLAILRVPGRTELVTFDLDDLLATIGTTLRADAVRDMIFSTTLALNKMIERQGIVGAAPVSPRFGDFSLRKGTHHSTPDQVRA